MKIGRWILLVSVLALSACVADPPFRRVLSPTEQQVMNAYDPESRAFMESCLGDRYETFHGCLIQMLRARNPPQVVQRSGSHVGAAILGGVAGYALGRSRKRR